MKPVYAGMATAVVGGAFGQLLMKIGMKDLPFGDFNAVLYSVLYHPSSAALILAGIFSYIVSMVVWVHSLKNHELSAAYPVLSLGYVIVYLVAGIWPGLNESITTQKTLGISLIIFGVWYAHTTHSPEKT